MVNDVIETNVILDYAQIVVKIGLWVVLTLLYYFALKNCFLMEGRSKRKLLVISVLTCPIVIYITTTLLMDIFEIWLPDFSNEEQISPQASVFSVLSIVFVTFLYFGLILACERIVEKWLRVERRHLLIFLYMMFNTVFIISMRGGFDSIDPSDLNVGQLFDMAAMLIMFFATWLFHHLVIRELPRLAHVGVNVNWRIFTLPPTFFAVLSSLITYLTYRYERFIQGKTILIIYGFSIIILFLFIWAFYVIIKNISATNEIKTLSVEVMEALAHTIDAKDEYTRGHSVRVAKYSRMLAEKMGLPAEQCESVYYMGLLHDIGKIGVPNEIINSPTKLTDEEYDVIKTHPGIGFDILAEMKSHPELSTGARWHHERFDGGGYPDHKTNEEIPLEARIIAVADSYDAMTSNRSYRKYMPQEKVRSEIEKNAGKQFDPDVAETMLGVIDSDVDYVLHE